MLRPRPQILTPAGHLALNQELEELLRKEKELRLETARMRELGDLSENAGHRAAKSKLRQTQGRIKYLQQLLTHARITAHNTNGRIAIGSMVTLQDVDRNTRKYHLVDSAEGDVFQHKITPYSPLGRLLLGKPLGAVIVHQTQIKTLHLTVVAIDS